MNPISIEAMVLPELSPADLVRTAAAAGFDHSGIWIDPATWTAETSRTVRAAFADTGISCLEAEVIRIRGPVEDDHRRILDIAAEIGARFVIAISQIDDVAQAAAAYAELARHAANGGPRVALEFGRFSAVGSIDEAVAIADAAGSEIAILPDPIHLARSGGVPADLARIAPARLGFAQICDADPPPEDVSMANLLEEARNHRRAIGEGVLPLADYVAALPAALPLSIESRSDAIRARFPDPLERARFHAATLRRLLNEDE